MHILAVDDDEDIRELLSAYLTGEGYRVSTAANAASMAELLGREAVDLVVLDLRLPDGDGLALVRDIRTHSKIPVIILSGKGADIDRIVGLEVGADDYLPKPFNPRELLARIKAVLRRAANDAPPAARPVNGDDGPRAVFQFAGWELDLAAQRLRRADGRDIDLTKAEFGLLSAFVRRPQRVLSREQLLDLTRVDGAEVFDRSIDVLILRLRRKIEENPSQPQLIKTERGSGYVFDAKVTSA